MQGQSHPGSVARVSIAVVAQCSWLARLVMATQTHGGKPVATRDASSRPMIERRLNAIMLDPR
jgi:hypothetical protein